MSLLKLIYDFGSDYLSKYFQSSQEEIEDPQDEINKLLEQLEDSFHEVNDREIQELVEEYIDYPCYQKSGKILKF
jgi:F0F1-type ATP synthase membrane subunit b/b'